MSTVLSYGLEVGTQVFILFILIMVGFFAAKLKLIDSVGADQFINVILYIVTPCVVIIAFLDVKFTMETLNELLIAGGCAVITNVIGIALSFLFIKVKSEREKAVLRYGVIFSNSGFMSLPLALALIGSKGVFYVSIYIMVFNILVWTYGMSLFKTGGKKTLIKIILNPGTIGVLIGLPLFLLSIKLPEIIYKPLDFFKALNTPVAMLVMGFFLMSAQITKAFKDFAMWMAILCKLLAVPLIAFFIFRFGFGITGNLLVGCLIPACAPSAVNTVVMSAKYGDETVIASRLVSICTLVSIVTMPLILMLSKI